jgi:predicted nucleotidyltransferase
MNRDEVLKVLRAHKAILARRFGVANLALFGSVARNEMSEDGDIDILIRFDRPATSKAYFGVQFYLEDLLGFPVDLVTDKALRVELRPYVEREVINI